MRSAASAASSGVVTSASPGTGTPCRASSALDSASERVGTPHDTDGPPPLRESTEPGSNPATNDEGAAGHGDQGEDVEHHRHPHERRYDLGTGPDQGREAAVGRR